MSPPECDEILCWDNLQGLYILIGGVGVTILVVAFAAYSRIQARLRPKDIFSVIIAAFDAFSDFAFTVQQLQTMRSEFECAMGYLVLLDDARADGVD